MSFFEGIVRMWGRMFCRDSSPARGTGYLCSSKESVGGSFVAVALVLADYLLQY